MKFALHKWVFVGLSACLVGGCSVEVQGSGTSSGNGGGGAGGMGAGGVGGMGTGGVGGMGTGGAGGTKECGGFANMQCDATEYCDYPDDLCGGADGVGICLPRPMGCPDIYSPTCACDGTVYGNSCDAASAGQDVSNLAGCMPPSPELFACGHGFCALATEYCSKTTSDVGGLPDSYVCAPLPAACGAAPTCACLPNPCGGPVPSACAENPKGGIQVTCPGG